MKIILVLFIAFIASTLAFAQGTSLLGVFRALAAGHSVPFFDSKAAEKERWIRNQTNILSGDEFQAIETLVRVEVTKRNPSERMLRLWNRISTQYLTEIKVLSNFAQIEDHYSGNERLIDRLISKNSCRGALLSLQNAQ